VTAVRLSRRRIVRLFRLLDAELREAGVLGEMHVVGGAVMCLAFDARESTRDVDALFRPAAEVRRAAARVAERTGLPGNWLNDAVKGFLGPRNAFEPFLDLPNLRVLIAHPRYMLAMKCASLRLGPEFHDLEDTRYLLRHLGIESASEALAIVREYFDDARIPVKTRLALEEMLGG
jgi:hypothetical protein